MNETPGEKELIKRMKSPSHKEGAFRDFIIHYQERIYTHIRRMVIDHDLAHDLTQETFIKVYRHIESFREDANLFTWVYRIATNECLQHLRKMKRWRIISLQGAASYEIPSYIQSWDGDQVTEKLQRALCTLPDKQRLVFHLRYYDDLTYEEIAEVTETSVGALKASYHHAVKKIEHFLTND
jgi:RNA polymerase sigma factor (sigma-70 family)